VGGQPLNLYLSPLRYPGGKRKIANFVKLLFLHNELGGCEYAELYAGGAAVALELLMGEYVSRIHINDVDRSIHSFWDAVLESSDEICKRIQDTRIDMDEWSRQKAVQLDPDPDPMDLAFSTFFLNRTNRSGIICGGVIGGKKQAGKWSLDARFNKADLIGRIEKVARYASRIVLTRCDAAEYLDRTVPRLSRDAFLFLDPPYYIKGGDLYRNFYVHADHERIAGLVQALSNPWLISYDAVPEISRLYNGFESRRYSLSYSAAERYSGSEMMFVSRWLEFPQVEAPARISQKTVDRAVMACLS
jgi:DNA adenine methylase